MKGSQSIGNWWVPDGEHAKGSQPWKKRLLEQEGLPMAVFEDRTDPQGSEGSLAQRNGPSKFHTLPSLPSHICYRSDKAALTDDLLPGSAGEAAR